MIKVEVLDSYMEQFENNKTRSFVLEERSKALIGVSNFTSFVRPHPSCKNQGHESHYTQF